MQNNRKIMCKKNRRNRDAQEKVRGVERRKITLDWETDGG